MNLTPRQKAAILLVSLPPEVSAQVFREFAPEEVQAISLEISKLPKISPEQRNQVVQEFLGTSEIPGMKEGLSQAGPQEVKRGEATRTGAMAAPRSRPLDFLRNVDPRQLLTILRKEHPQTIALVLSYLPSQQASSILGELSPGMQAEVAQRLAEIERISPDVLQEVEKALESKLFSMVEGEDIGTFDGRETLVDILSQSDKSVEEKILSGISTRDQNLAENLKSKLCEFEDLNNIDDPSLQQVLRLTDIRDLVLALKGADARLSERIYDMMSPEVARAVREDVAALGDVPWEEIRGAQQQMRNILRGLVTLNKVNFRYNT
ncbi:MAG: flagellar motor switch protein FliG [Candidatus Eremiobacteraeota bacterium]|nr:flagellar motor switch protein FliG [Candidatus Eremiobacteraeota bacterium]